VNEMLLLLFALCLLANAQTNPAQKSALISLHAATQGGGWYNKWNLTSDPCEDFWYGVKCTGPNVYSLVLQKNNLLGTIPPQLGLIHTLQFLYFSNNQIAGTIPSELGMIRGLIQIGFDTNMLTGSLPSEIGNWHSVQNIFFQDNQLSGGLNALQTLRGLQYLYLSRNNFGGTIPNGLADIVPLQQIGLDGNKLIGTIPANFGLKQSFFQSFFAQNNDLTGHFNGNLCHLPNCDCAGNKFSCPIPSPPCCGVTFCG